MATVKFGKSQLGNPTPSKWSDGIQVFTVLASAILAWVGTASFIPIHMSGIIQSILGLLIAIANGLKPFLGVETTASEVPIEKVTAMEVEDKPST
jgi:hypothetical protein